MVPTYPQCNATTDSSVRDPGMLANVLSEWGSGLVNSLVYNSTPPRFFPVDVESSLEAI